MYKKMNKTIFLSMYIFISSILINAHNIPVTDFSGVYHASVAHIEYPENISQLREIIINADKPIAIAGSKYSMGGQTWCQDGIVIDIKNLNSITAFDPKKKTITVQPGVLWSDLQHILYNHNLSIMVMQSYNDFSIGGSLSVNVHGRDPHGQIIESVESISVMLADGSIVKASRTINKDLFSAAIGGYGACGIIVEATLKLEDNYNVKRVVTTQDINKFAHFYRKSIENNPEVALFSATLYGPDFNQIVSSTWYKTDEPLTNFDFVRKDMNKPNLMKKYKATILEYAISEFLVMKQIRFTIDDKILKKVHQVYRRSYEMSYSVKSLAENPKNKSNILQEYFIPIEQFESFVKSMKKIIDHFHIKIINIAIRHVAKNNETLLTYAPQDSFAFVLYISIDNDEKGYEKSRIWTQKLINTALKVNGTYYLPYHLFASPAQFKQSYPNYLEFLSIKQKYDSENLFLNTMIQEIQKF